MLALHLGPKPTFHLPKSATENNQVTPSKQQLLVSSIYSVVMVKIEGSECYFPLNS